MILSLVGLFLFVLLSACFSGFESGVIAVNGAKLELKIDEGSKAAQIVKNFLGKPEKMLSLILLGNNTCVVLTAIFAINLAEKLPSFQYKEITVAILITLSLLTFAEILPKLWFRAKPLERSLYLAYPMLFFEKLTSPLTLLLYHFIKRLQRTKKLTKAQVEEVKKRKCEDFLYLLNESLGQNTISADVAKLLKDGLEFYNMKAKNLMTPLDEVVAIPLSMLISEVLKLGHSKKISRFPVYDKEDNKWIGVLSIYDVIFYFESLDWHLLKVKNLMRSLPTINQELTSDEILMEIKKKSQPLLAVTDNNNKPIGIISSADIIRPLLGEIA